MLAQEAARIIVDHGVRDYRAAKIKAAERLGMNSRGSLPRNSEIELAVSEHLQLFGRESHTDFLRAMREAALAAMDSQVFITCVEEQEIRAVWPENEQLAAFHVEHGQVAPAGAAGQGATAG